MILPAKAQMPHATDTLLIPSGERPANGWPAVLLLHDHGARFEKGWRKVIGDDPEPYYNGMAVGDSLAAHGYVVYCADALYWGTRRSTLPQRLFCDSLGGAGEWYARVLADDRAGIDKLFALPFVDTTRIAVAGFSYGAYRAWNLAATDSRLRVCIAAHWMTTLAQNRYNDSWLCMVRHGMYPVDKNALEKNIWTEFCQVAAGISPRPLLLQYGLRDKLFPINAVDSCVHYLDSVYNQHDSIYTLRKPDPAFQADPYDCGHEMTHNHLISWLLFLKKHL